MKPINKLQEAAQAVRIARTTHAMRRTAETQAELEKALDEFALAKQAYNLEEKK